MVGNLKFPLLVFYYRSELQFSVDVEVGIRRFNYAVASGRFQGFMFLKLAKFFIVIYLIIETVDVLFLPLKLLKAKRRKGKKKKEKRIISSGYL